MTSGKLVRLANIDHDGVFTVDQQRRFARIDRIPRGTGEHRPQQAETADDDDRDEQDVLVDKLHRHAYDSTPQKTSRIMPTNCSVR